MATSFKNKIALNFTLSTAFLVAVIFFVIYNIVSLTVFNELRNEINLEADKHFYEVGVKDGMPFIADKAEWLEREHRELEINPVFVQITDSRGIIIEKSPNLKLDGLNTDLSQENKAFFQTQLKGQAIVQIQVALKDKSEIAGYLIVAIPITESEKVLYNLKSVLLICFPVVLLVLFFVTRFIAGKSIQPVLSVISTAGKITNENLTARIPVPASKDELRKLVVTINDLMDRIENAVEREKQFTSDASHELRTPLAVIKGTLEVLIRKPRSIQEYKDKVAFAIKEINRISYLVDQLLLLARFESQKKAMDHQKIDLSELTATILLRQQQQILEKGISVSFDTEDQYCVYYDPYVVDIIIENVISNAVKYSTQSGRIRIRISKNDSEIIYSVADKGIGIEANEIEKILKPFYRSNPLQHPHITGNGLGLSIVKRMCELLRIEFLIESQPGNGTTASFVFRS
ncbi:sensor histidine kinase [Dyadobacter psychrotolerans]|uniref:histidine kinase n=1 Tax=Dyadobacter psychrotolerans TaxID=2541721 RepID=A0A4R5DT39_9BACT|nr:HAMP domain-containing sensor histidine kinase [Dyadobacter psychrotolerans]TDE15261.1 HAMP domain-containing histidine kinase [Dyadobacter psychrotolerans]